MKCPDCGKETDENLPFCRFCGARLKPEEPKKPKEPKSHRIPVPPAKEGGRLRKVMKASAILALVAIVLVAVLFSSAMFVNVPVGYALIVVDPLTKSVGGPVLGPTWYIKAPWVQGVQIYYALDSYAMWDGAGADEAAVKCFSRDQLEMKIDVMVRWTLDSTRLVDLYRSYPNLDWKKRTISSIARESMRFVTANFTAVETVEKRALIAASMRDEIWRRLTSEPSLMGAIFSLEFDLRNIALPASYTASIEAKLVAEQQKLQAEFQREKILILANATAQEAIIKAEGEAQSKVILANGTRQAIEMAIQAAGVTNSTAIAELYLWVEGLKQIAPDVNVLIITTGAGGTPLIFQLPSNSTQP